jgi:hypothetical protein
MAEETRDVGMARLRRETMGERLGGFVYGTIVVLAVVVAGAKAYPDSPGRIAALVSVTTGVFWLAHVYSHGLAHSIGYHERLTPAALRRIARREAALVEAGLPSVAALLLGAVGVLEADTSIWVAQALGLAVLGAEGVVFARVEQLTPIGTAAVVAANLGLGLLLVGMKILVTH